MSQALSVITQSLVPKRRNRHVGRAPSITKFGAVSAMWDMDEDARRFAIAKRAASGAKRTLGKRDIITIDPTPVIPEATRQITLPVGAPQWRLILIETAIRHNILPAEMLSARRDRRSVAARHEAMWRMKTETTMSLPAIGRRMGGRDHTTVIHGIRKHIERMEQKNAAELR